MTVMQSLSEDQHARPESPPSPPSTNTGSAAETGSAQDPDGNGQTAPDNQSEPPLVEYSTRGGKTEPDEANTSEDKYQTEKAEDKATREREKKNNAAKKPREQYSCVECFRRKQRCDRRFPCKNCIARRLPERCIPPPGHPLYRDPALNPPPAPGTSTSVPGSLPFTPFPTGMPSSGALPSGMMTPGIGSYALSGTVVPQLASQPVHLADFARQASEFGELRLPGHAPPLYGLVDQYRPNSAPGMRYHSDQDVSFAMGNKRRKLEQGDNRGVPRSAPVTVKPELSRAPSVLGNKLPTSDAMRQQAPQLLPPPPPREPTGRGAVESVALAETTARLARLERLLTLQDHTYAEKRLRLAEEAALRMLEGGGEASIPGIPSGTQSSRVNGRSEPIPPEKHSQHGNSEHPLRIDIRATEANGSQQRTLLNESTEHEDDAGDHHPDSADVKGRYGRWDTVEIIGDAGYTGAEGLNALTEASVLANRPTRPGYGKTFFARKSSENTNHALMEKLIGLSQVQAAEIRSLVAVLPTIEVAQHLVERYFKLWDWSRYPLSASSVFPQDWRKFYTKEVIAEMGMPGTDYFSSFAILLGTLALGSVSPVLNSSDTHVAASTYFWAASKALMYCETAGTNNVKTIWAKSVLVRYTDLVRNTQASWHVVGGWIRNAIDQGLHRDGTGFEPPLPQDLTAERRVLWSHVLHADREWALLLGRPLAINQYSTKMPDDNDLAGYPWDYRVYVTTRNNFIPILERISRIFQEHGLAYEHGRSGRQVVENDRNRVYQEVLAIDRDIDNYSATLPACFSLDPTKSNHALEQKYPKLPFYRSLITGAVNFHRILMHRPFMLKPIHRKRHPYRYSWQKCVETAVQDLRARTVWQKTLTPAEQTQTYGGSFAPFNSCVVLGLSILISLDMGEMPAPEIYSEHLTYLQDFVQRLQSDLDDGRDGTTAQKERTIMDSILARLDALINSDEGASVRSGRASQPTSAPSTSSHPRPPSARAMPLPSPGTSGTSTPYDPIQATAQLSSIDFDPFLLQALVQNPSTTFDPNMILDSQAPFDWEVYLSEMYNEGNLFMN